MSKENRTIQERSDELNKLLAWFDSDDFVLEKAMDKFKEAEALADSIKEDLEKLKNEVNVLKKKFDTE